MPANYVLLNRIELNASAASVTFSNIPQSGYTDLKIVVSLRNTLADVWDNAEISFNNSTTGYTQIVLRGNGSTVTSLNSAVQTSINYWYEVSNNATASTFGNAEIYIPNYAGSTNKSISIDSVTEQNATSAAAAFTAGLWSNTAAINTIKFAANGSSFVSGCTFSLYGLAAVGTTPVIAPKASGGNTVNTDGTYWYHTFTSSGTFTPSGSITCDYLVVAGGAGGGYLSGGGGAGGYRYKTSQPLTAIPYGVIVGAGGAGVYITYPGNGSNSSFASTSATGGGNGGYEDGTANSGPIGASGGSGGGAPVAEASTSYGAGNAGGYSPVEGYRGGGGTGNRNYNNGAGGGGGSSAVGGDGTSSQGGDGGAGTSNSISGTAVYYATGGGGAFNYNGSSGSGLANLQSGSGGNSISGTTPGTGNPNTGNGGGGLYNGPGTGGSGGSGIVIIRYPV